MKYKLVFIGQKKDAPIKFKNSFEGLTPYLTRSGKMYTGVEGVDLERMAKKTGISVAELSAPLMDDNASNSVIGSYWKMFAVRVPNEGLSIDTEKPFDELMYLFLKGHHLVANGWENKDGHHRFVIVDEEHEAKSKNTRNRTRLKALTYYNNMEIEEMRRCMQALGKPGALTLSAALIEVNMLEVIESAPQKFLNLWVDNKDKDELAWIEDAVFLRLIKKRNNHYYYGDDMIADTQASAILWKKDVKNVDIVKVIDKEVKAKRKIK